MKRAGVIGYPLTHSLSPAMMQAAFDAAGVEATYEAWPASDDQLEGRLAALRGDDFLGANVTIPHKQGVIPHLDRLDQRAERAGAVNTIANESGQLVGYNTDVSGFARSLREDAGFDAKGKKCAVIGAGGAARAICLALIEAQASYVMVAGRTPPRADALVVALRPLTSAGVTISWTHWLDGVFLTFIPSADLVVNCTPVGTRGSETEGESPLAPEHLPAGAVVFDLLYNPAETALLRAAKERGATPVGGLGMLLYQAAESFRIWTGKDASIDKMREAAVKALGA
jgi:shikimate dehydrogenase